MKVSGTPEHTLIPVQVVDAHRHGVRALVILPEGRLVTGAADGILRLWQLPLTEPSLQLVSEASTPHSEVWILHYTRHGLLVSAGTGGIGIWRLDAKTGTLLLNQRSGEPGIPWTTSPNDAEDYNDQILETSAGELITWGYVRKNPRLWGWSPSIQGYQFKQELADERIWAIAEDRQGTLYTTAYLDGHISLWQSQGPDGLYLPTQSFIAHHGTINALCFKSDQELVSGGDDQKVKIWTRDSANNPYRSRQTLVRHTGPVSSIRVTEQDHLITSGSESYDHRVFGRHSADFAVWQNQVGEYEPILRHQGNVRGVFDHCLLVEDDGAALLSLWKEEGGVYRRVAKLTGGHEKGAIFHAALLSRGKLVTAGAEDGRLTLWDIRPFVTKR